MPKAKEIKASSSDSDSGPDDRTPQPSKKRKADEPMPRKSGKSDDAAPNMWTLERMRQVRISEFRGRKMVDIREHYEKDGEVLPGKKGISLSITQWQKLLEVADEVNRALNK